MFEQPRRTRRQIRQVNHAINDFNKHMARLDFGIGSKSELIIHKRLLPGMRHDTRRRNK